jgi:hypothetical protein
MVSMREVLAGAIGLVLVVYLLYRLMRWARGRTKGAQMLGAVLTAVTQSVVVHEAKQGRKSDEGQAGDPPDEDLKSMRRVDSPDDGPVQ